MPSPPRSLPIIRTLEKRLEVLLRTPAPQLPLSSILPLFLRLYDLQCLYREESLAAKPLWDRLRSHLGEPLYDQCFEILLAAKRALSPSRGRGRGRVKSSLPPSPPISQLPQPPKDLF